MPKEAQARKARSIAVLKKESVPYLKSLPLIETESEVTLRSSEDVALRAIALCIVAVKGEGLEQKLIDKFVHDYRVAKLFTPNERKFIKKAKPSEHDRIQFAWRYECFWVMLWALGFTKKLPRPDKICDVSKAVTILRDLGRDQFVKKAKLRPAKELLDGADLIYRYHWAVVDARLNNQEPPGSLDPGVVIERHYALNWLIRYVDDNWDDISTDT